MDSIRYRRVRMGKYQGVEYTFPAGTIFREDMSAIKDLFRNPQNADYQYKYIPGMGPADRFPTDERSVATDADSSKQADQQE